MIEWEITKLELPLKFSWKISRGSADHKTNFYIKVRDGKFEGIGEVAFNSRYGEDEQGILHHFGQFTQIWQESWCTAKELDRALSEFDEFPLSLRAGIECALLDLESKLTERNLSQILGTPPFRGGHTSFSLPILEAGEIEEFFNKYQLARFSVLKLKVDSHNLFDNVTALSRIYNGPIRIDANEDFKDPDSVLQVSKKLQGLNIQLLEQPMPAGFHDEYLYLKKHSPFELFADESLTNENITEYFTQRFHGINVKIMKCGGPLKALAHIRQAKRLGLKVMIGCMVESSVGISYGLHLSTLADYLDLDGHLFLQNDPSKVVSEDSGRLFLSDLH